MLQDIGQVWWALLIAYTIHQVVWFLLHLLLAGARLKMEWSLLPDLLTALVSVNIFWALIVMWDIASPNSLYAVIVYIVVANFHSLLRYIQSQFGNSQRLQIYWTLGLNIGFGLFGLERLIIALVN